MNYIRSSLQHFSPKELDEKKKQGRRKLQQGPAPESGGDGPGADEDRPQKAQTVRSPSRSSLLASSGRPERRQPEGARGSSWSPSLRRPRTPEHPTRREFEEAARGAEGRELDERHREDRRRDKRREVGERGRREDRRECSVLLAGLGEELAARARHGAPGQTKDEIKGEKRRIRHTETSARIRPKEVLVKKAKECPEEKGGAPTRSLGRSRSRKRRAGSACVGAEVRARHQAAAEAGVDLDYRTSSDRVFAGGRRLGEFGAASWIVVRRGTARDAGISHEPQRPDELA